MGTFKEIDGDLIEEAFKGSFDVIVQGNNCFCVQGAGLAPQMVKAFNTDLFKMEGEQYKGDINKLGNIDYQTRWLIDPKKSLVVVNAYTQYNYGANHADGDKRPVDYEAIALVMRKINRTFAGKTIGIPHVIGAGLAGGNPGIIIDIIKRELKDMDVIMVKLNKNLNENLLSVSPRKA